MGRSEDKTRIKKLSEEVRELRDKCEATKRYSEVQAEMLARIRSDNRREALHLAVKSRHGNDPSGVGASPPWASSVLARARTFEKYLNGDDDGD